jgi:hypothetical protein
VCQVLREKNWGIFRKVLETNLGIPKSDFCIMGSSHIDLETSVTKTLTA